MSIKWTRKGKEMGNTSKEKIFVFVICSLKEHMVGLFQWRTEVEAFVFIGRMIAKGCSLIGNAMHGKEKPLRGRRELILRPTV